jgi:hypothetical protein
MPTEHELPAGEILEIDLRNPVVAAVWAWVWPGAGHIYQRRYAKGVLFMICILSTWFFGLSLADGHVVYAAWTKHDHRWQYICQLGVGAPALPALVESRRANGGKKPLFGGPMAPPKNVVSDNSVTEDLRRDELAQWHLRYHSRFELGTLYTVIAGLLNVLAIYDAYAGPVIVADEKSDKPPPDEEDEE